MLMFLDFSSHSYPLVSILQMSRLGPGGGPLAQDYTAVVAELTTLYLHPPWLRSPRSLPRGADAGRSRDSLPELGEGWWGRGTARVPARRQEGRCWTVREGGTFPHLLCWSLSLAPPPRSSSSSSLMQAGAFSLIKKRFKTAIAISIGPAASRR